MWKVGLGTGLGFSETAVWSRASRRHASKIREEEEKAGQDSKEDSALGFKVVVEPSLEASGSRICIRWVKGNDSVLFESFCGMLKRKLEEAF